MVEISIEEKKSGISGGVGLLLIRVILSSKMVTNVLARSSADELIGYLFSAFLWSSRSFVVVASLRNKIRVVVTVHKVDSLIQVWSVAPTPFKIAAG